VNRDEYVTERSPQSGAFERQYGPASEEQKLAGIVYRTPSKQGSRFDAGAGVRLRFPLDPYVGSYERLGTRIEVERRDGGLTARSIATGPLAEVFPDPVTELELVAVLPDVFVSRRPGETDWTPMVFYELDDGSRYLHSLIRATPKLS